MQILPEYQQGIELYATFDQSKIFSIKPKDGGRDFRNVLVNLGRRIRDEGLKSRTKDRLFQLAAGKQTFPYSGKKNFQWVFGGQYLRFEDDMIIVFNVTMRVNMHVGNSVKLKVTHHHHKTNEQTRDRITSTFIGNINNGELSSYQVVYRTGGDTGAMELNQFIQSELDFPVELEFVEAYAASFPVSSCVKPPPILTAIYKIRDVESKEQKADE